MKPDRSEHDAFQDLLRRVLAVPHSEIKARLEAEKAAKKRRRGKTPVLKSTSK